MTLVNYIRVKEALTFMLEWHGQYEMPSDNVDFMVMILEFTTRVRYSFVLKTPCNPIAFQVRTHYNLILEILFSDYKVM